MRAKNQASENQLRAKRSCNCSRFDVTFHSHAGVMRIRQQRRLGLQEPERPSKEEMKEMSSRSIVACVFALFLSACGGSSSEEVAVGGEQPSNIAPKSSSAVSEAVAAGNSAAPASKPEAGNRKATRAAPAPPEPVRPAIQPPPEPVYIVKDKNVVTTTTGLRYVDLITGKGMSPKRGQTAVVHYIGRLANETVFNDTHKKKHPLECTLGAGRFLRGWEEGLSSMKVGGKRKLIIPPRLGYGRAGNKKMGIPPNSYVIFEVELLAVR